MSESSVSSQSVRDVLARFGLLRPQPPSEWRGEHDLPLVLARFYEEVGPYGEDGPYGPVSLSVPTLGNPFSLPRLGQLWDLQAGYRWDGRTGARIATWRDEWLVVADQGGDPFILDRMTGSVLHAWHGQGGWQPEPLFADVFAMALALGTIGAVHDEAGEDLCDDDFEVRPAWRSALRTRLAAFLGAAGADAVAARFDW